MREIKFRFWATSPDYPDGKMYLPENNPNFLLNFHGDVLHTYQKGDFNFDAAWARIGYNDRKIMQYTGLQDKNGKDIYEGDILTFKDIYAGYVAFEYAEFITKAETDYAMSPKAPNSEEVYEVIGNIYQHPELKRNNND